MSILNCNHKYPIFQGLIVTITYPIKLLKNSFFGHFQSYCLVLRLIFRSSGYIYLVIQFQYMAPTSLKTVIKYSSKYQLQFLEQNINS